MSGDRVRHLGADRSWPEVEKAAHSTAVRGESTCVETTVAMELAES